MADAPLPPRPFYYLEHLEVVLHGLLDRYQAVLDAYHRGWIHDFLALPHPARGLYARFIHRRGCVFREERLRYPELHPVPVARATLEKHGWVQPAADVWELYPVEVLACFTHTELKRAFPSVPGKRRREWETAFFADPPSASEVDDLLDAHPCWFQEHTATWERLNLLYFGRRGQSTEQFVIHELGHVTVAPRVEESLTLTFSTRRSMPGILRRCATGSSCGISNLPGTKMLSGSPTKLG